MMALARSFLLLLLLVIGAGAPIMGMIIIGIVQTLFAFTTMSPTLNEQFNVLVNLSVVTNVIPYIIALSGLMIMMKTADTPSGKYNKNAFIASVGIIYSIYAIYASGFEAVMGGTLVLAVAWFVYGFISYRQETMAGSANSEAES